MRHCITKPRLSAWRKAMLPVVVGVVVSAAACGGGGNAPTSSAPADPNPVSVVTTLYPLEYFAGRVGGDRVTVVNLVPPGAEAHSYEPTPSAIRSLDAASVIIYNGSGFEPWIPRALGAISTRHRIVVDATRDMPDIADVSSNGRGGVDPHVWLDPLEAIQQVERIRDALGQSDAEGASVYASNAQALIGQLTDLHQRFASALKNCRQEQFVTPHAAFGHLAKRYGLQQVSIAGLSPEAEPEPGDLASIAESIQETGIGYIMVEPLVSPRIAETLAREVGATLLPLHPLESLTPEEARRGEDYFTIMDANLVSLRRALECEP